MKEQDPYDTPEHEAFIDEMTTHCHCEFDCPCEGVLCGGLCDQKKHEPPSSGIGFVDDEDETCSFS